MEQQLGADDIAARMIKSEDSNYGCRAKSFFWNGLKLGSTMYESARASDLYSLNPVSSTFDKGI